MPSSEVPLEAVADSGSAMPVDGDTAVGTHPTRERLLRREDELVFPLSKGAFAQYREDPETPRHLRIFYRDKEIAFADPAFFPFGEALVGQSRFRAGDAVRWADLEWPRVRLLLEQLITARVLRYAEDEEQPAGPLRHEDRPSPLEPARCPRPRTWDETEEVMGLITGRPLELGQLELVVPVFRVAHMYLDADDRQIGEANTFPPQMRLERPTIWRTCPYSGSRYQPDLPMNVTALRAMRNHWRQAMAVVRRVSDSYRARFPAIAERGWTVGDIERMTACVGALASYPLMRRHRRVENGRLHPALSAAFRLTDGSRTLMHDMLFSAAGETAASDETPMTGAELHAYAERNYRLQTTRAVCAGPPAMIDDFLAVALDGADPRGGWPAALDADVADALGEVEAAIDYGLTGLQVFAAVFSHFPLAAAGAAALRLVVREWPGPHSARLAALRSWLETASGTKPAAGEGLHRSRLAAYDALYRQCGFGLSGRCPEPSLLERYATRTPLADAAVEALKSAFESYLYDLPARSALCADLADCLGRLVGEVQAALLAALEAQGRINALLGRSRPAGPFLGRDLARFIALERPALGKQAKDPLFLVDGIADLLGIAIEIGPEEVKIGPKPTAPGPERLRSPGGSA